MPVPWRETKTSLVGSPDKQGTKPAQEYLGVSSYPSAVQGNQGSTAGPWVLISCLIGHISLRKSVIDEGSGCGRSGRREQSLRVLGLTEIILLTNDDASARWSGRCPLIRDAHFGYLQFLPTQPSSMNLEMKCHRIK